MYIIKHITIVIIYFITVQNVSSQRFLHEITGYDFERIEFSHDGNQIYGWIKRIDDAIDPGIKDNIPNGDAIVIFDLRKFQLVKEIELDDFVYDFVIDNKQEYMYFTALDYTLYRKNEIYSHKTKPFVYRLYIKGDEIDIVYTSPDYERTNGSPQTIAISSDNRFLAIGDSNVQYFLNLQSLEIEKKIINAESYARSNSLNRSVFFGKDNYILNFQNNRATVIDWVNDDKIKHFFYLRARSFCFDFMKNSHILYYGTIGAVVAVDLESGRRLFNIPVSAFAPLIEILPKNNTLLISSDYGLFYYNQFGEYDYSQYGYIDSTPPVLDLKYHDGSDMLSFIDADGTVKIWSMNSGNTVIDNWNRF